MLGKMLKDTSSRWLSGFLSSDFVRVSPRVSKEICERAGLSPNTPPRNVFGDKVEKLYEAIQKTKLMAPPTDCLSPIGEKALLAGLYKQIKGDFYTAVSRPPAVYRGNPFVIEAGLAFGSGRVQPSAIDAPLDNDNGNGLAKAEGEADADKEVQLARVIRYANRVPLLHQQSSCSVTKAVLDAPWRNYGLSQSRGALPQGPLVVFVHMASVWVPFTSEAKEAIADYDEIRKEIKLALCEAGRRLGVFIRKREQAKSEFKRRNVFQLYIGEVVAACNRIKNGKLNAERLLKQLQKTAKEKTGGELTDKLVKKKTEQEAESENTIIVTEDGPQGDVPVLPTEAVSAPPSMDTLAPPSAAEPTGKERKEATADVPERKARLAANAAPGDGLSRRKPLGLKSRAAATGKTKALF
jgi:DNA topoisomerase-6 subunit B